MFNNFAQQINTPNVSENGHSVMLECNKSINYVMVLILNSYSLPGTLLARAVQFRNQIVPGGTILIGCENCTWWWYLLFQLEKKGGGGGGGTKFF